MTVLFLFSQKVHSSSSFFIATVILQFIYVPKKRIQSSAIDVHICKVCYGICPTTFE